MSLEVRHEPSHHRFAAGDDQQPALLTYREEPGRIVFVHTEVSPALEGKGLGGQLARAGLGYAQEHHLLVVPRCPFVAGFLKKHPEFDDLVDPDYR